MDVVRKSQTISVLVLTHNHQETISRLLGSLSWADQIVIVDAGSTDGTLEAVRPVTEHVYFHPAPNEAARLAYGLRHCEGRWVLLLKPTEWVPDRLRHEMEGRLLAVEDTTHGFSIPRMLYLGGEAMGEQWLAPECRLLRRDVVPVGMTPVGPREGQLAGKILPLENPVGVEPYASFSDLFQSAEAEAQQHAWQAVEQGPDAFEPWQILPAGILWEALQRFGIRYWLQGGCSVGLKGLVLSLAESYRLALTRVYYRNHREAASASPRLVSA